MGTEVDQGSSEPLNIDDNDLKSQIISAFNEYFNVDNWEFGETFYFTELSSFVHQRLGSNIGSIVIIPKNTSLTFLSG